MSMSGSATQVPRTTAENRILHESNPLTTFCNGRINFVPLVVSHSSVLPLVLETHLFCPSHFGILSFLPFRHGSAWSAPFVRIRHSVLDNFAPVAIAPLPLRPPRAHLGNQTLALVKNRSRGAGEDWREEKMRTTSFGSSSSSTAAGLDAEVSEALQ